MTNSKAPLNAEDAAALLSLLATDDAFRAAFQADPAAALEQISPAAASAACGCDKPSSLASPEQFVQAREQLLQTLTSESIFSYPFCFIDGQAPAT